MISPDLRVRLEGRVEALETELRAHHEALLAAKTRQFERAADVLSLDPMAVESHGDEGLLALLEERDLTRAQLSRCVETRLRSLGMPAIDLAAGARWLVSEPVLYEHHRVTLAFALRVLPIAAFLIGLPTAVAAAFFHLWPGGLVVGLVLFVAAFHVTGWSDAILTERRLILDGRIVQLAGLWRVVLVRPWFQVLPMSWEVELHYRGQQEPRLARLRHASTELRYALQSLRIDTGTDWGPW